MKKQYIFLLISVLSVMWSCSTDETTVVEEMPKAAFTATPTDENPNYIVLENQSTGTNIMSSWKFKEDGPFVRGSQSSDTTYYPNEGTYKVTLYTGNNLGVDTISQEIIIEQRDPDLPPIGGDDAFLLLGDFEDGEVGDWNAWGQDVSVVSNPAGSAVNSSDLVLKMTQTEPWQNSAVRNIPQVTSFATKIVVDVYFEQEGDLKLQIEGDFATGYFQSVTPGEWVTLEYTLEGEVDDSTEYPWILFQGNTSGSYYIDNIKYYALDIGGDNGTVYGDFEDEQVGDWNAWNQDVSVIANPAVDAVNSSDFVLLMTQVDPFSVNAVRNGQIVGVAADKITVDVYFEQAGSLKLQLESDFETGYFLDVEPGKWVTLEYDLNGQIDGSIEYPWVVIQGNTPGNYYIDNITYYEQ
ncbi:carbohydrate binding domain-containing protein [Flammeovirga sp. SubArs3]|uniref:carbohydrate binding domain-containing protein n=1 Tax=Flammeovirga sp. SubArs3 TaxID=2995316 RepID=UPI00248B7B16|nr:carbohydrate binding domain-containing protein [Flammeovirga sp. SubArs3]